MSKLTADLRSYPPANTTDDEGGVFNGAGLSDAAAADFDLLCQTGVDFAESLLAQQGGFSPFGFTVKTDGKLDASIFRDRDPSNTPDAELDAMLDVIRPTRDDYRAVALFTDVTFNVSGSSTEMIRICLEHRDGGSLQVLMPYTMTGFRRKKPKISTEARAADWPPRLWV